MVSSEGLPLLDEVSEYGTHTHAHTTGFTLRQGVSIPGWRLQDAT